MLVLKQVHNYYMTTEHIMHVKIIQRKWNLKLNDIIYLLDIRVK